MPVKFWQFLTFSKFICPGTRRIATTANRDALQTTTFRNPNGSMALAVINQTDKPRDYPLSRPNDSFGRDRMLFY